MNRRATVNLPLLASLAGTIVAAALGVRMSIRLDEVGTTGKSARDPAGWANGPVPRVADPGLPPPEGGGQGRLIPATFELPGPQSQPDGSRTRRYVIYRPADYFPERSYPLVVWLGGASAPITAESTERFARIWGPAADRDRYLVLYPELTGDAARGVVDLSAIIAEVKQWWYVDRGPVMLAYAYRTPELNEGLIGCGGIHHTLPPYPRGPTTTGPDATYHWADPSAYLWADHPVAVHAALADRSMWAGVQIDIRPRRRSPKPAFVTLVPVPAARVGRVVEYRWDGIDELRLEPSPLMRREFFIAKPGTHKIGLTIRNEAGQTFRAEGELTVPSPGWDE